MPIKADIVRENKKKIAKYNFIKVVKKIIKCFCIIVLCAILLISFSAIIYNKIRTKTEIESLKNAGLYNMVSVENSRKINLIVSGNENSKYTIVTISDIKNNDFTIYSKRFLTSLNNNVKIALIDRAGYGFSDDSNKNQNCNQIINDYKTALSNAGIKAPYILLADGFGGSYATYWAQNFPDDIAGIIYVNGHEIEKQNYNDEHIKAPSKIEILLCKIGFNRLRAKGTYRATSCALSSDESNWAKALSEHSSDTNALASEIKNINLNYKAAFNNLDKIKSIPKIFINSYNAFSDSKEVIDFYKFKNNQNNAIGKDDYYKFINDEKTEKDVKLFIDEKNADFEKYTLKFVRSLGTCEIVNIAGENKIYEQKPDCVSSAIDDFVSYIDGDKNKLQSTYNDSKAAKWEEYYKKTN